MKKFKCKNTNEIENVLDTFDTLRQNFIAHILSLMTNIPAEKCYYAMRIYSFYDEHECLNELSKIIKPNKIETFLLAFKNFIDDPKYNILKNMS